MRHFVKKYLFIVGKVNEANDINHFIGQIINRNYWQLWLHESIVSLSSSNEFPFVRWKGSPAGKLQIGSAPAGGPLAHRSTLVSFIYFLNSYSALKIKISKRKCQRWDLFLTAENTIDQARYTDVNFLCYLHITESIKICSVFSVNELLSTLTRIFENANTPSIFYCMCEFPCAFYMNDQTTTYQYPGLTDLWAFRQMHLNLLWTWSNACGNKNGVIYCDGDLFTCKSIKFLCEISPCIQWLLVLP